ncbi:hypothetical protein G6F42_022290 [Rhizopus arrhizus]|nr:hypothetical protein G6F42_022290 [Rhizopus arrhizus]
MTISNDEVILQKMLSTMETLRADQLRLAEQFEKLSTATPPQDASSDPLSPSTSITAITDDKAVVGDAVSKPATSPQSSMYPSRVILTTYPGQHGIKPLSLNWGAQGPKVIGPRVESRHAESYKKRFVR